MVKKTTKKINEKNTEKKDNKNEKKSKKYKQNIYKLSKVCYGFIEDSPFLTHHY